MTPVRLARGNRSAGRAGGQRARGLSEADVAKVIALATEERQLGFLGAPRVNLLVLNLELDKLTR